jgi:primosomal protein N' (replication factor Y)
VIDRLQYLPKDIKIDFELTALQQEVLEKTQQSFAEKQVCLLHGVTSSGKLLFI